MRRNKPVLAMVRLVSSKSQISLKRERERKERRKEGRKERRGEEGKTREGGREGGRERKSKNPGHRRKAREDRGQKILGSQWLT